jgi:RNA polymerase sigma-70 factor (ECF subfamily)
MTDKKVFGSIKSNKSEEIHQLFDRYYRPLVSFANEYLPNLEDAKDIVSDFFLQLLESDRLTKTAPTHIGSYLFISVKNACIKACSKKDVLRDSVELKGFDLPDGQLPVIDEERIEQINRELNQLPPQTKRVVEYVVIKGLKYKEAAEELGISIHTVHFLLKEGMKKLRNKLIPPASNVFILFFYRLFRCKLDY